MIRRPTITAKAGLRRDSCDVFDSVHPFRWAGAK